MSNKRLYITLGIIFINLTINGCQSNDNSSVVSAFSDSVMGIEVQEPVDSLNEGQAIDRENSTDTEIEGANASQGEVADSNVDVVEHTALTQEEIDELKASATTDMAKRGIEGYEAIINNGSWEHGGTVNEVVGKPGDTSWRQMTDEEAQAALEKDINDIIADAELNAGTWNKLYAGKLYFNPYEYVEAMRTYNDAHRVENKVYSDDELFFN